MACGAENGKLARYIDDDSEKKNTQIREKGELCKLFTTTCIYPYDINRSPPLLNIPLESGYYKQVYRRYLLAIFRATDPICVFSVDENHVLRLHVFELMCEIVCMYFLVVAKLGRFAPPDSACSVTRH